MLWYFIGVVILVLSVNKLMSVIYKEEEKEDTATNYYKLTYRKRVIRSLQGIPFILILYFLVYWFSNIPPDDFKSLGFIFLFLVLVEMAYSFIKWQITEK